MAQQWSDFLTNRRTEWIGGISLFLASAYIIPYSITGVFFQGFHPSSAILGFLLGCYGLVSAYLTLTAYEYNLAFRVAAMTISILFLPFFLFGASSGFYGLIGDFISMNFTLLVITALSYSVIVDLRRD